MKPDEIQFWFSLIDGQVPYERWGDLTKRQYYLLDKWTDKGFWEFGVSMRSGWLTPEGKEKLMSVKGERPLKPLFEGEAPDSHAVIGAAR